MNNPFGWDYPPGAEHDPNAPWNQADDSGAIEVETEIVLEELRALTLGEFLDQTSLVSVHLYNVLASDSQSRIRERPEEALSLLVNLNLDQVVDALAENIAEERLANWVPDVPDIKPPDFPDYDADCDYWTRTR